MWGLCWLIHRIELPVHVVVGSGALSELPRIVSAFAVPGRPIAVISGPNVWRLCGGKLREQLESLKGVEYSVFEAREATIGFAERLAKEVIEVGPGLIVGFGGGKSVDLAKYAALRSGARMVSVPTSPSHDGIASPFASLKGTERPYSIKTVTPIAIVADIDIMASAPLRLIRAGAGDLIAKLTAVRDWKLAHKLKGEYYGEYAAKLALLSAKHAIEYAGQIGKGSKEGVRVLVEGLVSSGVAMCIAGSTRPASGSEHLFAHALEMLAPGAALHGEEVALGTIMMMYLHGGNWRKVKLTLKKLGLPTKARELGLDDSLVVKALTMAHKVRPERYTILGETGLTWEAAERLARVTGVID
jgi:glycerol-1-phosphate dehydrogenase [NAD(P)+]